MGEASIDGFVRHLRAQGLPEAEVSALFRCALDLQRASGLEDLRAIQPEHARLYRAWLEARQTPPEAIAQARRAVAALYAFQAAPPLPPPEPRPPRAAPPAPAPPPRPPPPSKGRQAAMAIGLLAVIAASAVYTVRASRQALNDTEALTEQQAHINKRVRAPKSHSYLDFTDPENWTAITEPPPAACGEAGRKDLARALALIESGLGIQQRAVPLLEHALEVEPNCVAAGRILAELYAREGLQAKLLLKYQGQAKAEPGNATAQLMLAFFARKAGNGEMYKEALERASAARPDLPLLEWAWGHYLDTYADPIDQPGAVRHFQAEVERTGDPASMGALSVALAQLRDHRAALSWCARYFAAQPDSSLVGLTRHCLAEAFQVRDAQAESAYRARSEKLSWQLTDPRCVAADTAKYLVEACRPEEALAEATRGIELGCVAEGAEFRRMALLELGRDAEAAQPPSGQYRDDQERYHHAVALALTGEQARALALLESIGPRSTSRNAADRLVALLQDGATHEQLALVDGCKAPHSEAEREASAAGAYVSAGALEEGRARLERAMAQAPDDPTVVAVRLFQLTVDQKLDEAVAYGEAARARGVVGPSIAGNLAYAHQLLGHCERALPLFQEEARLAPVKESNYTNWARCLESLGRSGEAERIWRYTRGGKPQAQWWVWALLALAGVALYLGGKLALIKLAPRRFGHLRFP